MHLSSCSIRGDRSKGGEGKKEKRKKKGKGEEVYLGKPSAAHPRLLFFLIYIYGETKERGGGGKEKRKKRKKSGRGNLSHNTN